MPSLSSWSIVILNKNFDPLDCIFEILWPLCRYHPLTNSKKVTLFRVVAAATEQTLSRVATIRAILHEIEK